MKLLIALSILMSGFVYAADAVKVLQDKIASLQASHQVTLDNREAEDASYSRALTGLQAQLAKAQATPSPTPSPQ